MNRAISFSIFCPFSAERRDSELAQPLCPPYHGGEGCESEIALTCRDNESVTREKYNLTNRILCGIIIVSLNRNSADLAVFRKFGDAWCIAFIKKRFGRRIPLA